MSLAPLCVAAGMLVGWLAGRRASDRLLAAGSSSTDTLSIMLLFAGACLTIVACLGWASWRGLRGASVSTVGGAGFALYGLALAAGWWLSL